MFVPRWPSRSALLPTVRFRRASLAVIASLALIACSSGGIEPPTSPGSIIFGSSFDTKTFAVSGQRTSFPAGSSVALVAVFSSAPSQDAQLWIVQPDGSSAPVAAMTGSAGNDIYGTILPAYYFAVGPGNYGFKVKDAGGNTLASGSVVIT